MLAAQDQIGLRVAGALDPGHAGKTGRRALTANPAAHDAYLKGRYAYCRYGPASFAEALKHFSVATELDPGFAETYAHQAYCRTAMHVFPWPGSDDALDAAGALARRAVGLDDASALAHARLGWVLGYRGRAQATVAAFDAAVMRDRDNAEVYLAYGGTMNRLARPDRALELLALAFSKDGFHPPSWEFAKDRARALLGEHDRAIAHFTAVLNRVERFISARVQRARSLQEGGRHEDALDMAASIKRFAPKYSLGAARRVFPYPDAGHRLRLDRALTAAGPA